MIRWFIILAVLLVVVAVGQDKAAQIPAGGQGIRAEGIDDDQTGYIVALDLACCGGRVGDANGSGEDEPTIGDVSVMIDAKFIAGSCDGILSCLTEADVNQSGGANPTCDDITVGDISVLIDYLFITGSGVGLPPCLSLPTVTTADISAVTVTTARCGGTVIADVGTAVTARGICWSTNPEPTVADNSTSDGTGPGTFESTLTGLTGGTTYFVRAYAANGVGIGYGAEVSFTTVPATVTDIDGNVYQTVTIGTQVWMLENLKVTHYRNGDVIPNVTAAAAWAGLTTGAYCEYNNTLSNVAIYGRLYNWYAVNDSRSIAPTGWHVASEAEWQQLEAYLGMDEAELSLTGYRGTTEGGKLKEAGTTHWASPNVGATNESGFSALPGGFRDYTGAYYAIYYYGTFWTTTPSDGLSAWSRHPNTDHADLYRYDYHKRFGFSVRCVKD